MDHAQQAVAWHCTLRRDCSSAVPSVCPCSFVLLDAMRGPGA